MSWLVDSDICSVFLQGNSRIGSRFLQHGAGIHVSVVTVAELYTWAHRSPSSNRIQGLRALIRLVKCIDVDVTVAETRGEIRARLLAKGIVKETPDLLIAATALAHQLTLVTHNVRDFADVPDLNVVDWLTP